MTEVRAQEDRFLGASPGSGPLAADTYAGIVGLPWDAAVTYRGGAAQGPSAIRIASDSIESYCPKLGLDLVDGLYVDFGDISVPEPAVELPAAIDDLDAQVEALPDLPLLGLGGDHLAALPFIRRALNRHPDLQILHIDAHGDLRDHWEGEPLNHSTVMRRVLDRLSAPARLHQWGIRSGTREEFELAEDDPRIQRIENTLDAGLTAVRRLVAAGRPIYLTVDVDGVDPADIPGTGTPEPDGLRFGVVEGVLGELVRAPRAPGTRLVGADVVELAPSLDGSGRSAVAAARLVRTLLLALRVLG